MPDFPHQPDVFLSCVREQESLCRFRSPLRLPLDGSKRSSSRAERASFDGRGRLLSGGYRFLICSRFPLLLFERIRRLVFLIRARVMPDFFFLKMLRRSRRTIAINDIDDFP